MQGSWGRCVAGTVRNQCGWSRVSEGERGRRGGQGGDGTGRAGPCGPWRGLRLLPEGEWSPGGLWAEEGWDLTRVSSGV